MTGTYARFIAVIAWVAVIAIAFATLTRVGFVYDIYFKLAPILMRPDMRTYAHYSHIIAFALLGALFALAYPRRILLVGTIVLGGAVLLEIAQTITPDRHGTLTDAFEKIAGGVAGIFIVRAAQYLGSRKTSES